MNSSKTTRLIILIIAAAALLILPVYFEMYYPILYYIITVLLIPTMILRVIWDEKFDERFYKKWQKAKKQGFWLNAVRGSFRMLLLIIIVVSMSQFVANGLTPFEIVTLMPDRVLIFVLLFILAVSIGGGIASWFENNKRFNRIYDRKNY